VVAALKGMGWEVFYYWNATTTSPTTTQEGLDRFRESAENADAFVQIVERDLGGDAGSPATPIMKLECQWYCDSRNGNPLKPMPLVVSIKNPSLPKETKEYIDGLMSMSLDPKLNENRAEAMELIVSWLREIRDPSSPTLVSGMFDTRLVKRSLDQEVKAAFLKEQTFPQKYLYTSPVGGMLWRRLIAPHTSVGRTWEKLPLRNSSDPLATRIIDALGRAKGRTLSIVALGCGDGEREAGVTQRLAEWIEASAIRVLLVDASKTLVGDAYTNHSRIKPAPLIRFALVDFEEPDVLVQLRADLPDEVPCVVLFFGNTLGNIAIVPFLEYISAALRPGDILVLEVRVATQAELGFAAAHQSDKPTSAHDDEKFEFITNPIRFFGLTPRREQFYFTVQATRLGCRRTFFYEFSRQDEKDVEGTTFASVIRKKKRLDLVDIESFVPEKLFESLREVGFDVVDNACEEISRPKGQDIIRIPMGYIVAVKNNVQ
jgi:hypothetical protein